VGVTKINIKEKMGRLSLYFISASVYLPVFAGIITPMIWVLLAWYSALHVVGIIFPFSELWTGLWRPIGNEFLAGIILIAEFFMFCLGVGIFLRSFSELVREQSKEGGLVTSGLYQIVRHPQHLGIALALLPIALINPSYSISWIGIRPGDIFAWSFVTFLLLIVSELEEVKLISKFGDEYQQYCKSTPFFIPWNLPFRITLNIDQLEKGKPGRYILGFAVYWCIMVAALHPFTFVNLVWAL